MNVERFRWLVGVIAAHSDRKLVGRTRLQKEMRLLQRLGMPSDYDFRMHYYGPYSEGLQADVSLLESFGLVTEAVKQSQDGNLYSVFTANSAVEVPVIDDKYIRAIRTMERADATVLELASTYDGYRVLGLAHESALQALRAKKGAKCDQGRERSALDLLSKLGINAGT